MNASKLPTTVEGASSCAAHGCASELERRLGSTKDGLDGRGAGGVHRIAEGVTLILGDCLSYMPIIADAVVSDPPYGVAWDTNYQFSAKNSAVREAAEKMVRKKHPLINGDDKPFDPSPWLKYPVVVLWGANNFSDRLPQGSWLVWDKRDAMENAFMSEAEAAWMNRGKSVRLVKHCWQGFSRASENSQHYHPTQKPVAVMAWCMDAAKVPEGATVLDPYMGSGTTGIACLRTGRKFIGIESDPTHFATAVQRFRTELAQGVLSLGGGGAELVAKDSCDSPKSPNDQAQRLAANNPKA